MKITPPKAKHIRFDIDRIGVGNAWPQIFCEPLLEVQSGKNIDRDDYWIALVSRINYYKTGTNNDIIGYLGETKVTVLSVENTVNDLKDLRNFVGNAYLNAELYLGDNLINFGVYPPQLSHQSISDLAQKILNLLLEYGLYK